MVINHLTSKTLFALSIFIFSASVQAFEYSSLSTCRGVYFDTVNQNGTPQQADVFCKPKMDPIVFCTEQAVMTERMQAQTPYTNEQIAAANAKYHNSCVVSGGATVSVNVAGAAPTAPGFTPPANTLGVPVDDKLKTSLQDRIAAVCAPGNTGCANTVTAEYNQLKQQYDSALAIATQNSNAQAAAQAAANPPAAEGGGGSQGNPMGQMAQMLPALMSQGQSQPQAATSPASSSPSTLPTLNYKEPTATPLTKVEANKEIAKVPGAQNEITAKADALKGTPVATPATKVADVSTKEPGKAEPTPEITGASETLSEDFKTRIQQITTAANTNFTKLTYDGTAKVYSPEALKPLVDAFEDAKTKCTESSEKTEKLCVEGSSPGAQAVRLLMDAAGPMMMAMNAQKSCSATSKVSELAGLGLTVANGVCIASKMKCEDLCKAAVKVLEEGIKKFEDDATIAYGVDGKKIQDCITPTTQLSAKCAAQKAAADPYYKSTHELVSTTLNNQIAKSPGTPKTMLAKCESKIRNIIGMMTNIASLAMAKKGSDDCEKKLATSGAAGNALTSKQFCEDSANSSSSFCKCQSTPGGQGCGGFTAPVAADGGNTASDVAGANIKPGSGLSNFAGGGFGNGAGGGGTEGSARGANGEAAPYVPFTSSSTPDAVAGSAGAGGGLAGGGAGGGASDDGAKKLKKEEDDKKWSFGAVAAGVSSMFGGGKGGAGNGNMKDSNTLEAGIQRKIASDKFGMEVTPASGVSNWEKIHKTVIRVENSLMRGN